MKMDYEDYDEEEMFIETTTRGKGTSYHRRQEDKIREAKKAQKKSHKASYNSRAKDKELLRN
jgi:hypothetical protein